MMLMKHSPPPHITDQNVNKVGDANAQGLFSLPNISGSLARVVEVLLCLTDVSIPAPPFDLVMARANRCPFHDKSGILVTPLQKQPSHYHIVHEQLSQILFH